MRRLSTTPAGVRGQVQRLPRCSRHRSWPADLARWRLWRFESVLDLLPKCHVFDGELVVLDDAGRPLFNELMFGHGRPTYAAFDLLEAHCVDLRPLPHRKRKAMLAVIGECAEAWIALTNGLVGEGRALYRAAVDADPEGIVAKRLTDADHPKHARWHKILNRGNSQRRGYAEWFQRAPGAPCRTLA